MAVSLRILTLHRALQHQQLLSAASCSHESLEVCRKKSLRCQSKADMSKCSGVTKRFCWVDISKLEPCCSALHASELPRNNASGQSLTQSVAAVLTVSVANSRAAALAKLETEATEQVGDNRVSLSLPDIMMDGLCGRCSNGKYFALSASLWNLSCLSTAS